MNIDNYNYLNVDKAQDKYTFINFTTFINAVIINNKHDIVSNSIANSILEFMIVKKSLLDKLQNLIQMCLILLIYMCGKLFKQILRKGELTNPTKEEIEVILKYIKNYLIIIKN